LPDLPGWDSLEAVTRYHGWAEIIGIVVLALLVLSEVAAYRYGHRKDELATRQQEASDKRHDEEMARLHAETEASKARAAEAELRIKRLEPRNLNWSTFVTALRGTPSSPVDILYFADDFDSMMLAQQIDLAIREAGWAEPSRNPIEKPFDWTAPTPMAVDGQPTGVTLVATDRTRRADEFTAGNMLLPQADPATPFRAIERALLAGVGKLSTWVNGPHAPPEGRLRIVVAPRE
jgi:hypothetical protein